MARNAAVAKKVRKLEADNGAYELEASRLHDENARMSQQIRLARVSLAPVTTPPPVINHNDATAAVVANSSGGVANHSDDASKAIHDGVQNAKESGGDSAGSDAEEEQDDAADDTGEESDDDSEELDAATEAAVAAAPEVQAAIGLDASSAPQSGSAGSEANSGEVIADPAADDATGAAEEVDAGKAGGGQAGGGLGVLSFLATKRRVGEEGIKTISRSHESLKTSVAAPEGLPASPLLDLAGAGGGVGGAVESISTDPQAIVKSLRAFGEGVGQVLSLERQGEDRFQAAFDEQCSEEKHRQANLEAEFKDSTSREKTLRASQKSLLVVVKELRAERDKMEAQVAGLRRQLQEQQAALASLLKFDGTGSSAAAPNGAASVVARSR